jgi:tRNA modification GTPase
MGTWASVMTGKGVGAIATIQVFGERAHDVVRRCFRPARASFDPTPGRDILGSLVDGDQGLDEVVVGCEGQDLLAIHCHGNPLIVEAVMVLLERCGAAPVTAEALLTAILSAGGADTLQIEARLTQARARTLEGVRIVQHQASGGLRAWLLKGRTTSLGDLKARARQIVADSAAARLLIEGCTAVLMGPTNSGKSTLFNWLSGQDRSLVSDIRGTTRDWVQAECRLGPLCLDLIDTAGLDFQLTPVPDGAVDRAAQDRTLHWAGKADLILLVLDASRPVDQIDPAVLDRAQGKPWVTVFNKSDLKRAREVGPVPAMLSRAVQISASDRTGKEALTEAVSCVCGVSDLAPATPVAFTPRQLTLVERLARSRSSRQASAAIDELLHGPAHEGTVACR